MLKNYYSSVKKWETFLELVKKNEDTKIRKFSLVKRCGYCEEFMTKTEFGRSCLFCPLYPRQCNRDGHNNPRVLFWRIVDSIYTQTRGELERLTVKMLKEVRRHKDKFKDEGGGERND